MLQLIPATSDTAIVRVQLYEIVAPTTTTLKGLHHLIQAAMGWQDCHLWEFQVGDRSYGDPDPEYETNPPTQRAASVRLRSLIERGELVFTYVYDFGDNWRHVVTVEAVEEPRPNIPYPSFIEGARRCPPEDVGGTPGYEAFLESVTTPRHRERRSNLDWYGGPYDPKDINRQLIEYRFAQIAKQRARTQARKL